MKNKIGTTYTIYIQYAPMRYMVWVAKIKDLLLSARKMKTALSKLQERFSNAFQKKIKSNKI